MMKMEGLVGERVKRALGGTVLSALLCAGASAAGARTHQAGAGSGWMESLGLSPGQIPPLLRALAERREALSPLFSRRKELLAALSGEIQSAASNIRVQKTLKDFDAVKARMRVENDKFLAAENEVLTPLQRAKLITARSARFQKMRAFKGPKPGGY